MPYRQESVLKLRTPFEHLLLEILLFYVVHLSHIKSSHLWGKDCSTFIPQLFKYPKCRCGPGSWTWHLPLCHQMLCQLTQCYHSSNWYLMSRELYVKAAGTFCLADSLEYLVGTLCASGFFFIIFLKTKCITKQRFSVCGIRDIQGCLRLISSSATLNIFQGWTGHIKFWAWIKVLKEAVKKCPSTSPTDGIGNS